jgi:hypothetical protein
MADYTAKSVGDIADFFETLAGDQLAARRWLKKVSDRRDAEVRAAVYDDCANIIRQTKIETP